MAVTKEMHARLKTYGKLREVASHVLRVSSTPWAPWILVREPTTVTSSLTVGKTILEALQQRLADKRDQNSPVAPPVAPVWRSRMTASMC